jgi:hypothetical protein
MASSHFVSGSRAVEPLTIHREGSERRPETAIERPQGRTAEMREDEPLDAAVPRRPRDRMDVEVATDTAREADRVIPRRRLREHQVRAPRPARELAELRSPDDRPARRLDQVAARRMTGVHDGVGGDAQPTPGERPRLEGETSCASEGAKRGDELAPGVGHEPGVEPARRHRPGATVDHDAHATVDHQEAGRGVPRRILRTDAEGDQPHAIDPLGPLTPPAGLPARPPGPASDA